MTIDNDIWKKGYQQFLKDFASFHSVPSILNSSTLAVDKPMLELQHMANHHPNGVRRYDGTWADPYEVLDEDFTGDEKLSITYDENDNLDLSNYNVINGLGWLGSPESLKQFVDKQSEAGQEAYSDMIDGNLIKLLSTIKEKEYQPNAQKGVKGRFVLAQDENGEPYWQELLVDSDSAKKLELAGVSLVNTYGPQKYSDGAVKQGLKSFTKGVADIVPNLMQFAAGTKDLGEALVNGFTGEGFHADYTTDNEIADDVQKWLDDSWIGQQSYLAQQGVTDNWEGFASGLGQGASSLVQFGVVGKGIGLAAKGVNAITKGLVAGGADLVGLTKAANKVRTVLSEEGIANQSLGTIGKTINSLAIERPELVMMYGSGLILNYGEAYQAARQAGLPLEDAATIGWVTGIANTLVEQKFGPNTMAKYLVGGGGAKKTAETIIREVGGDINKLSNKAVSDNVLKKVFDGIGQFMKTPVLGQMFEEGAEEIMQGFTKNSVEAIYDNFFADDTRFGTNPFAADKIKENLEEGLIGTVLGAFGGFVNSRQKENKSIIPLIANGDYESVIAGAKLARQKDAISQEQYDGIVDRATKLNDLRNKNRKLFNDAATSLSTAEQMAQTTQMLSVLRDQEEFAKKTDVLDEKEYYDLVNRSRNIGVGLDGIKAFSTQLRSNGKNTQADELDQLVKDSERTAKQMTSGMKQGNNLEKHIVRQQNGIVQKQVFGHYANIAATEKAQRENNNQRANMHAKNARMNEIDELLTKSESLQKLEQQNQLLLREYENPETTLQRQEEIKRQLAANVASAYQPILNNKKVKSVVGGTDYVDSIMKGTMLEYNRRTESSDLANITSEKSKQYLEEQHNQLREAVKQVEKEAKRNQEINKDKQEKQEQEETAKESTNPANEQLWEQYKNAVASEEDQTDERKQYVENITKGDELTQVNALEQERAAITKALNELPKEERVSARADALRNELKTLNKLITHLRTKYSISKSEADKNKRYKANLTQDEAVYTTPDGKKYKVDRKNAQYSENEGMIYYVTEEGVTEERTVGNEEEATKLNEQFSKEIAKINYFDKKHKEAVEKGNQKKAKEALNRLGDLLEDVTAKLPAGYYITDLGDGTRIHVLKSATEIVTPAATEYNERDNAEFFDNLTDENGIPFRSKIEQDKRTFALRMQKVNPNLLFRFEPVSEGETGVTITVEKEGGFANMLKCPIPPHNEAFKSRLADSRTNAELFTGRVEAYIWDGADKDSKKAKELFDKIRKDKRKWSELTEDEKQLLIDYLPIQASLQHPYIKDSDGKPYTNHAFIPTPKSSTSKKMAMHDDQVEQRTNAIRTLVDRGSLPLKKGDIQIQPGFFNTSESSKPTTIVDEYGQEHKIAPTINGDLRDVKSLGIIKENGKYYITLKAGETTFKMPLTVAIADNTGTIRYTYVREGNVVERVVEGKGSPGTPYLVIPDFLSLNKKENYPLKLNPRRIDKNTATAIANLMHAVAKGTIRLNSTIKSLENSFGINTDDNSLTVKEFLDDVIFYGNETLQNDPNPAFRRKYLENKQLVLDINKGVVKYGSKLTVVGDEAEDMERFINWITNNKSFSIERARIVGQEKMKHTYSIENGYSSTKGDDYVSTLVDNKVVTTNLDPEGPLYRGQSIRLKPIGVPKTKDAVQKPAPVETPPPPTIDDAPIELEETQEGVITSVFGMVDGKLKRTNTKPLKSAVSSAKKGTTIVVELFQNESGDLFSEEDSDKKVGNIKDITFEVEAGKINGIPVDPEAAVNSQDGISGAITKIVKERFPDAAFSNGKIGNISIHVVGDIKPTVKIETKAETRVETGTKPLGKTEEDLTATNQYKQLIEKIDSEFKEKTPSKSEIDNLFLSITGTDKVAQLYGFKDKKDAQKYFNQMANNGKTVKANLTEYMSKMNKSEASVTSNKAAQIIGKRFGVPQIKGATKTVSRKDMLHGYEKMSEQEKKQLAKILGRNASVEWVDNFIDAVSKVGSPVKAFGVMTRGAMVLSRAAKQGTGYHEAFHNVSLFALSNADRAKMYEEARKNKELEGKTDTQIEEWLADEFMKYAMRMQGFGIINSIRYKGISGFFQRIWDYMQSILGFKPKYQDINTLFKQIYSGRYSNFRTKEENLIYFDEVYGKDAKVPLVINGVSLNMDSRTFSKVINNLTANILWSNSITSLESVRKGIDMNALKNELKTMLDELSVAFEESTDATEQRILAAQIETYGEIYNNFDSVFRPHIENKLAQYGIRRRVEDSTFTIDEDLKNMLNDEVVSAWEVNSKHNAKAEIRMLFLALPSSADPDPITYLAQYANPDVVWYNVYSKIHSAKSFDEMMNGLLQLSDETIALGGTETNPYYYLRNMLLNSSETLKTQFFVTFKKHKNRFINMIFSEDKKGLDMDVRDADLNKRSNQINRTWSKQFAQTQPLSKQRKEEFKELSKNYQEILNDLGNSPVEESVRKVVELLAGLNIIVDDNTIYNLMNNKKYSDTTPVKSLRNLLQSSQVANVFGKGSKTLLGKIISNRINIDNIDNILTKESMVKMLAESYVRVNPSSEDDSVIGPGGNAVYAYSENNTVTSMFEDWLKDEQFVNQMLSDPYSAHSVWLNQLTDSLTRSKLGVKTMLAIVNKDDQAGSRGYLEISDKEDLLIKLKAVMDGLQLLPTLANKKSYYYIDGIEKQEVKLNWTEEGGLQISDDVIDVFTGYYLDEISAMTKAYEAKNKFVTELGITEAEFNNMNGREQRALINKRLKESSSFAVAYADLIENYHYTATKDNYKKDGKTVYDTKMVLNGNGYHFRYFRNFNESNLENAETYSETDEFKQIIREMINARINDTIKLFINNGIINVNSKKRFFGTKGKTDPFADNSKIAIDAIDAKAHNFIPKVKEGDKTTMIKSQTALAEIIADYAINTAISTIEFEKIVSGDLAFYKTRSYQDALDDRVKRYSAVTSTKQMMRDDVQSNSEYEVDFDTKHYRSITLSTNKLYSKEMFDIMFDKYVGTKEKPGLLYSRFLQFAKDGVEGYVGLSADELYTKAQEDAGRRLEGYLGTDPTDAQVWISPKMFRKLAIMNGEWSAEKQHAYELLESDKELSQDEESQALALVMQPLKYIHYGFMYNSQGVKVAVYDKMSLATVFKRNVKGTKLEHMYDYMIDNDVDMVKMETAVKSGNRPKQSYLNENGEVNDLTNSLVYEQEFKYIGKQLVTDPHEIERTTLLTQFTKIGVSNVNPADEYDLDGRKLSGADLLQEYVDAINRLSNLGVTRIMNKFGIQSDGKVDKRKFVEMLNKAALQTNVPQNLLDALKYSEESKDYYIELSTLPSLNWIQSRIISMIKKETVDITTPGNAFYQTTSFGYNGRDGYRKLVGDNTKKKYDHELRFRNEHGRMEVKLSINLFRGAIPSNLKTFEEQRSYILANKELFGFAYRVPTQGMNSTLPIEIVDVLPSNSGDVILLPLEVTALTGSDFDIDKMYLARYNYYDDNGKMKKVQFIDKDAYSDESEFLEALWLNKYGFINDKNYKLDRKNVLSELDYIGKRIGQLGALNAEDKQALVTLAQDYSKYISKKKIVDIISTESDPFEVMKKIRNHVTKRMPVNVIPLNKFMQQNTGKSKWELNSEEAIENHLLDIFSSTLTSDNHYIDATTPLDVTTDPLKALAKKMEKYFGGSSEVQPLAPLFPAYQEDMKSKNTGADAGIGPMALINVFRTFLQMGDIRLVTSVGDNDIMQSLGIDTLNKVFDDAGISILDWTSALINAHVDAAKDPYIIKLNVNRYTYNMTALMISAGFGESTFYFMPQPILKDLADNYMRLTGSDIGITPYEKYSKKYLDDVIKAYESEIKGDDKRVDEKIIISHMRDNKWLEKQIATPASERNEEWYKTQLTILDVFLKMQQYADAMRDCVNAVQIDTAKFGINAAELLQFTHLVEKVKNSKFIANPMDLFNKTFLNKKFENSVALMFKVLNGELLDFTRGFTELTEVAQMLSGTYFKRDTRTVNAITNELKTQILGGFMNEYCAENVGSMHDLFYGKNSVVNRVQKLQKQIAEGMYTELADNELLKMLLPNVYNNDTDPMTFENSITKQRDVDSKNAYTFAWMDLLEHYDESIRKLGNDLILYAFYSSGGLSSGIYNFYDLVPYGYLANLEVNGKTYQQYVKDIVHGLSEQGISYYDGENQNNILNSVFKALWKNDYIVPSVSTRKRDGSKNPDVTVQSTKEGDTQYVKLSTSYFGFMTGNNGMLKPYIKLDTKSGNDVELFKLVGVFNGNELVYAKTDKTGYAYKGFRIKEVGSYSELSNNSIDTDWSNDLQFKESFKNGAEFTAINPFQFTQVNDSENILTSEGDIESNNPFGESIDYGSNIKDAMEIFNDSEAERINEQKNKHDKKCNR